MRKAMLLLLFVVVFAGVLYGIGYSRVDNSMAGSGIKLYYRGFGVTKSPGFLGRHYYAIRQDDNLGYLIVSVTGVEKYNSFVGYYPDGKIKEAGHMFVSADTLWRQPFPERNNVKDGVYYKYDGTVGSVITNWTGIQSFWTTNGVKIWELSLSNNVLQTIKSWKPDGRSVMDKHYAPAQP